MKIIMFMGMILISSVSHAKSHFVKFKNHATLQQATTFSVLSDNVLGFRPVASKAGAFAVIESELDSNQLKQELEGSSFDVAYVEPNEIDYRPIEFTRDDVHFSSQWGLNGKFGINPEKAWAVQKGSIDVVVAVIDTGVDYTHPDLKKNILTNEAELNGEEGVDDDGNGVVDDIYGYNAVDDNGDPMDLNGHGTHCAGVIGAGHNIIGVAGVMADVMMLPIKIFNDQGRTSVEAIVRGIEYATANGAKITSNSWGGGRKSQAVIDAIKAAGEAGSLFVAAAGNGNVFGIGYDIDDNPIYPAGYELDNILSVGSITSEGTRSRFSNFGKKSVDLFAPGSDVISTYLEHDYKELSGTSMATPHVSGVAGLVAAEFPGASAEEIKSKIMEGTNKLEAFSENSVSGGILDAAGALGQ